MFSRIVLFKCYQRDRWEDSNWSAWIRSSLGWTHHRHYFLAQRNIHRI